MNWHTSSKAALQQHPAFAAMDESFRASVTESVPALSIWRKAGPLPTGTRWDVATNSVIFPEPIELARLGNVYDATAKGFLYIPNYVGYGATLSADGLSLRCGLRLDAHNTDTLTGTYARDVTASEVTGNNSDAPADWMRPVLVLDLTQLNDSRLYDGAFPAYCIEARTVTARTPAHCLWCYVSEIATGSAAPAVVDTATRARVAQLEAAIAQFNKSVA